MVRYINLAVSRIPQKTGKASNRFSNILGRIVLVKLSLKLRLIPESRRNVNSTPRIMNVPMVVMIIIARIGFCQIRERKRVVIAIRIK